jgi:DNA-binding GntR family transcriptional regulator
MKNSTIKTHPTLANKLTAELREAIVIGKIPQGSKISEPELAKKYDVNRGPLREAIRRLEGVGLVQHTPHAGVRVVTLNAIELTEIYQVREALEGMATRLAATNMSDDEIDSLKQLLDKHEESIKRSHGKEYFQQEGDFDFHYRIIKGSKNLYLINQLCSDLYHLVRMYRYRSSRISERPARALAEHKNIVTAIEQHDGELAEMLMRRHISTARKNIEHQFLLNEEASYAK